MRKLHESFVYRAVISTYGTIFSSLPFSSISPLLFFIIPRSLLCCPVLPLLFIILPLGSGSVSVSSRVSIAGYNGKNQSTRCLSPVNTVRCRGNVSIPLTCFDLARTSHSLIYCCEVGAPTLPYMRIIAVIPTTRS